MYRVQDNLSYAKLTVVKTGQLLGTCCFQIRTRYVSAST